MGDKPVGEHELTERDWTVHGTWDFSAAPVKVYTATSLPACPSYHCFLILSRQASNKGDILYMSAQAKNGSWAWLDVAYVDLP